MHASTCLISTMPCEEMSTRPEGRCGRTPKVPAHTHRSLSNTLTRFNALRSACRQGQGQEEGQGQEKGVRAGAKEEEGRGGEAGGGIGWEGRGADSSVCIADNVSGGSDLHAFL